LLEYIRPKVPRTDLPIENISEFADWSEQEILEEIERLRANRLACEYDPNLIKALEVKD